MPNRGGVSETLFYCLKPFGALALLLAGLSSAWAPARASIANSHHDIALFGTEEGSGCAVCHESIDPEALKDLTGLLGITAGTALGPIGNFCFSCHDGTITPGSMIEAPDGSTGLAALLGGHGFLLGRMEAGSGGLETQANLAQSGLFAQMPSDGRMECIACHDPHAAENPPFLRAPLSELCQKCHSGRDNAGLGRYTLVTQEGVLNQAHPVLMPYGASGLDKKRDMPQEQRFRAPDPLYDVPARTAFELTQAEKHWEMGGHLMGQDRVVSCATCHSAHLPKPDQLVYRLSSAQETAACSGCHGDGANPQNPGMTPFYHPVFESSSPPYLHDHASHAASGDPNLPKEGTWNLFVKIPDAFPLAEQGQLTCQTCHVPHGGAVGRKCLRSGPLGKGLLCHECHRNPEDLLTENPQPPRDTPNMHHPVSAKDFTAWGFPRELPWSTPDAPALLDDGIQCTDCHSDLAKSAHNW